MPATSNIPPGSNTTRSRTFLVCGIISVTLMAFLSGLDEAFVYIFGGIGTFCLFMWYWTGPRLLAPKINDGEPELFQDIKNIFSKKHSGQYRRPQTAQTSDAAKGKFMAIVFSFVFFVFFAIVFFVISFSDDARDDNFWLYQQAEQFRSERQYDSAKIYFRRVVNADPENVEAFFNYGNVHFDEENYDSAIYYYSRTLELNAEYDVARYYRSLSKYYLKNYAASRADAFEILEINPGYDDATLMIGDSYYAENQYDSAIYWYEAGYDRGVRSAPLSHVMAYIYDKKNQQDRAIEFYKEALSYDSTKVEIYQRLGELIPSEASTYWELYERFKQ